MKCLPSFLIGAVAGAIIGAIVALLLAPFSGEELRSRIGQETEAEREKLQAGYEKAKHQVQEQIETIGRHGNGEVEAGEEGDAAEPAK
jgi:gas vesicle protein